MYSRAYKLAVAIPPIVWVTAFLLVPYAILFCYSFWSVSSIQTIVHNWNVQNYLELARNSLYPASLSALQPICRRAGPDSHLHAIRDSADLCLARTHSAQFGRSLTRP